MENNNHLVGIEKKALYEELQEEDYIKYKKLARHLEMVDLQESYIKDEQANLKFPNVATNSGPLTGNKRKHANSGASMPPTKWFKGADLDPMETDPEIVGDEMEGMEHTPGNDVMMDVDMPMEDVDSLFEYSDDKMDVNLNMDDLNGHIRHSMLEVPSLEYIAVRVTYLS
ncbi:hypothetical protein BS47DRAFT_1390706 [Hydnum rufescens UP504]|uniref:Uncharacterized protein n=1 Tax=Hydnum rufescens UP504 TaxID=1448309 RepID=A0A9P6B2E8_9AGAM|nr:hypothetical protein BS47DRAFT_1390706 [Hydnum rufescens UP504]